MIRLIHFGRSPTTAAIIFGRVAVLTRVAWLLSLFAITGIGQIDDIIRVETELVSFEFRVTDAGGNPVSGLSADEFRVFENGLERKIDFFQPMSRPIGKRPLALVFALDVSGSMTVAELESLRSSLGEFVRRLEAPDAYFSVITFAMNVRTVVPFTNRKQKLIEQLGWLRHDRDGLSTHAYDAVDAAVRYIVRKGPKTKRGQIPQRAVVVITDGFPVGDVVSPNTVIERANNSGVSVHSVILPSFLRPAQGRTPVITPFEASRLTESTGGMSILATDKNLDPILTRLAAAIEGSYVLAFYPERNASGEFRSVKIESIKGYEIKQNRSRYQIRD
ncbi:MAG: VWA domain-containing protein [Acidobacteria bacterium]|nr:VWA domain-containing protein [Acidobacteriota bacterium]